MDDGRIRVCIRLGYADLQSGCWHLLVHPVGQYLNQLGRCGDLLHDEWDHADYVFERVHGPNPSECNDNRPGDCGRRHLLGQPRGNCDLRDPIVAREKSGRAVTRRTPGIPGYCSYCRNLQTN